MNQLCSLRFASDAELPELARMVLAEKLDDRKAIKKQIRNWQADITCGVLRSGPRHGPGGRSLPRREAGPKDPAPASEYARASGDRGRRRTSSRSTSRARS